MAAAKLDLVKEKRIQQGATFTMRLTFKDSTGALVDVSGKTFRGKIKQKQQDPASVGDFSFVFVSLGVVDVVMAPAVTSALPAVEAEDQKRVSWYGLYDIEEVTSLTEIERLLEGEVEVSPEITK